MIIDPALRARWRSAPIREEMAHRWITAGVEDPYEAQGWGRLGIGPEQVPAGFTSPYQWKYVIDASLPPEPQWGALCGLVDPQVAAAGHVAGKTAAEVAALGRALAHLFGPPVDPADTNPPPMQDRIRLTARHSSAAYSVTALDWTDVAACVLVEGMSLPQAREHVASGADMEPMRVLLAMMPS